MSPCRQTEGCVPKEPAWILPAGILNVLWGDIYPRLVAEQWLAQGTQQNPHEGVWPGMSRDHLIEQIEELQPNPASPAFEKRKKLVIKYLNWDMCVPISVPAQGAYDFVLHGNGVGDDSGGLELFIPKKPKTPAEILRFYSYRETGRPALGLPFYLDTPFSAVAVEAPRGPGMVWVLRQELVSLQGRLGDECGCVACAIKELLEQGKDREPVPFEDLDAYTCLVGKTRCWQVEGTVYRALMTEVPRIVATIWLEAYIEAKTKDYATRFPMTGDDGLRSIFEERLELNLPDENHMAFGTHDGQGWPKWTFSDPGGWEYDAGKDVIITNQGFYFPETKYKPEEKPAWSEDDFLKEIVAGRAGNPVFSSTDRTEMD